MANSPRWYCTRQRAGPLVKECRSLRPRLSADDSQWERSEKNRILRPPRDSSVCRSRVDRLELRLALFGWEGDCYTLTFDNDHLPPKFKDVRLVWRAFLARLKRWKKGRSFDYIYLIEGKHGDHRYHIHLVLRNSDFSPAEIRSLWKCGTVDDEPLLRGPHDSFRRMAKYFNKEATDGFVLPIGSKPWCCSRSLTAQLPPPEMWRDTSGAIDVPDDVYSAGRGGTENQFGAYHYAWYIEPKRKFNGNSQTRACACARTTLET